MPDTLSIVVQILEDKIDDPALLRKIYREINDSDIEREEIRDASDESEILQEVLRKFYTEEEDEDEE